MNFSSVFEETTRQLVQSIDTLLGHQRWRYETLGTGLGASTIIVSIREHLNPGQGHLLIEVPIEKLQMSNKTKSSYKRSRPGGKYKEIVPFQNEVGIVLRTQEDSLHFIQNALNSNPSSHSLDYSQVRLIQDDLQVNDQIYPCSFDDISGLIILKHNPASQVPVLCWWNVSDSQTQPETIVSFEAISWSLHYFLTSSSTLFSIGEMPSGYRLQVTQLSMKATHSSSNNESGIELSVIPKIRNVEFVLSHRPVTILPLSLKKIIIVDTEGNLYFLNVYRPRPN